MIDQAYAAEYRWILWVLVLISGTVAFALCLRVGSAGSSRGVTPILLLILFMSTCHELFFAPNAEDMYISLRYVKNLLNGHGLVFNIGERVEGYSNFLWIMVVAIVSKVTGISPDFGARLTGWVFSLITVVLTYRLAAHHLRCSPGFATMTALFTAASGSLATYGVSGFEVSFFSTLLLTALLFAFNGMPRAAGIATGALALTRPEGVFVAPVLALYLMRSREDIRAFLMACGMIVGGHLLWRQYYYGHWVPNTVAAKSGMDLFLQLDLGTHYVFSFISAYISGFIIFFFWLLFIAPKGRINEKLQCQSGPFLTVLATLLVYVGFFLCIGGDWMPSWRYLAPVVPLFTVVIFSSAAVAAPNLFTTARRSVKEAIPIAILFIIFISHLLVSVYHPKTLRSVRMWSSDTATYALMGKYFKAILPPDTLIAFAAVGAFGYFSDLPLIDTLGLTDEHIARQGLRDRFGPPGHLATDHNYVAARRPVVMIVEKPGVPAMFFPCPPGYVRLWFRHRQEGFRSLLYVRPDWAERVAALLRKESEVTLYQR